MVLPSAEAKCRNFQALLLLLFLFLLLCLLLCLLRCLLRFLLRRQTAARNWASAGGSSSFRCYYCSSRRGRTGFHQGSGSRTAILQLSLYPSGCAEGILRQDCSSWPPWGDLRSNAIKDSAAPNVNHSNPIQLLSSVSDKDRTNHSILLLKSDPWKRRNSSSSFTRKAIKQLVGLMISTERYELLWRPFPLFNKDLQCDNKDSPNEISDINRQTMVN